MPVLRGDPDRVMSEQHQNHMKSSWVSCVAITGFDSSNRVIDTLEIKNSGLKDTSQSH